MADQKDRARVLAQQLLKQIEGLDVEVVGGFVQDQHVGGLGKQPSQQQPVALPATERAHRGIGARWGKQEILHVADDVFAATVDFNPLAARADGVGQGRIQGELVAQLIKVGHFQLGATPHLAAVGLDLAQDQLEQRGFARAVGAHQANLVATLNDATQPLNEHPPVIGFAHALEFGHQLAAAVG